MKAAVATKPGDPLDIREVPLPEIGAGQVLVRVRASGICHTDLRAVIVDGAYAEFLRAGASYVGGLPDKLENINAIFGRMKAATIGAGS